MKIATHTALPIEPDRSTIQRSPASSSNVSALGHATAPTKSSQAFSGVLQSLSTGSTSSPVANVSPESLFGPAVRIAAAATTATTAAVAAATTTETSPTATAVAAAPVATTAATANPGIQAMVSAIMNGSIQPTYVTNPAQLQETYPLGTDYMPSIYYASDATANQLASLLGGTVVQRPPFGQDQGWTVPPANFIQLPSGQTVNAADLAQYANCGFAGASQLTADLTAAINEGSAWANYNQNGGSMPSFPPGYVGPPISGMTYPPGSIGADGNVINPAMQNSNT